MKDWSLDFGQEFEYQGISDVLTALPSGVARFVARKNAPLVDKSCSSSLNGSDLGQMVHNRIGRLSLGWMEIWNESLGCNGVFISCDDSSSWMYLHDHNETSKRDQKAPEYDPLSYVSD